MPKEAQQIPLTIGPGSEYGWLGGLGLNEYLGRRSSYSTETDGGIDPFRKPGVLQAGFRASSVNSFINTPIVAAQTYSASGILKLFGYDYLGKIYQIDTSNHANVSVIASLQSINEDYAFAITRDYLFAMHNNLSLQANVTRFGPLSTGVLATTINASLTATVNGLQIKHVLLPWKSNLYAMHANNIDYFDGNGISTGIATIGARLPSGMVIKTACSFGDRIAVGASDNLGSSSNRGSSCKVYLYDGVSYDWQKEIPFPENDIKNLAFEFGELIAWGIKWKYKYNSSTNGFESIESLDTDAPAFHGMHDTNDSQIYYTAENVVRSYGSPIRYLERVMHTPFTAVGTGGICKWVSNTRLYVSNSSGNFYYLSSSAETGVRWKSRFIEADGRKFRVAWIRVVTETLSTNDSLQIEMNDKNSNNYVAGTMTFSEDGAILTKEFFAKDFTTEPPYLTEIQIALLFNAGNVKVRRVDLMLETASEY